MTEKSHSFYLLLHLSSSYYSCFLLADLACVTSPNFYSKFAFKERSQIANTHVTFEPIIMNFTLSHCNHYMFVSRGRKFRGKHVTGRDIQGAKPAFTISLEGQKPDFGLYISRLIILLEGKTYRDNRTR